MTVLDVLTHTVAQATSGGGNPLVSLLPIVLMFVVLYFLMIRPQMKRQKEARNLVANLAKGDEVITSGGLLGKISQVNDSYVTLTVSELAEKPVDVILQKASVTTVLPKGTLKGL